MAPDRKHHRCDVTLYLRCEEKSVEIKPYEKWGAGAEAHIEWNITTLIGRGSNLPSFAAFYFARLESHNLRLLYSSATRS